MASDRTQRALLHIAIGLLLFWLLSCDRDGGVLLAPQVPLAYTRFIHAVPDTGATDWRFIDALENSPPAFGLVFRGSTPYQATAPGQRRLRIFPTTTDISVAPRFLVDTMLALEAGAYYTIVHFGRSHAGSATPDRVVVFRDDIPSTAAGTFALRFVHVGSGIERVDVYASSAGGATPLPPAPLFTSAPPLGVSSYTVLATGTLALRVTSETQTTPILVDANAPRGEAANPTLNLTAIGGSQQAGSVVTAFLLPRSVAGSAAPQAAAFTVPALLFLIDRHPR